MGMWFVERYSGILKLSIARFGGSRVCIVMQDDMMTGSCIGLTLNQKA